MKVLRKWKDSRYQVENTLYLLKNNIKLLHTLNKNSLDTVISIVINLGSYHDRILGLPSGTAHFYEHMAAANPNKMHSTKRQIDLFEFGNKKRPAILTNAFTGSQYLGFWGTTNSKGENRLARRLSSIVDYPTEKFPQFIEKERKIIVAERNSYPKTEKYEAFQFFKFLLDHQSPNKETLTLGEVEDINSIKTEHLEKVFNTALTKGNGIIAVQSPTKIKKAFRLQLEKIAESFNGKEDESVTYPPEKFENLYRYKHFTDEKSQGVKVVLTNFQYRPEVVDYKNYVLSIITTALISHVGFKRLREKLGLVYYFQDDSSANKLKDYWIDSLVFASDSKDLKRALDETHKIIFKYAPSFLETSEGKKWFEDKISRHIYPSTMGYQQAYAENKAATILKGKEPIMLEKVIEAAQKISIKDVQNYLKKTVQKTPPHVWIVSSNDKKEVYSAFKKSDLHKHWSTSVPKKSKK